LLEKTHKCGSSPLRVVKVGWIKIPLCTLQVS
jgi:hypothetical protein